MPVGKDEPVPVEPVRIGGIEPHEVLEQYGRDVGHSHWGTGMSTSRFLHGIHVKKADAVRHVAKMLVAGRRHAS